VPAALTVHVAGRALGDGAMKFIVFSWGRDGKGGGMYPYPGPLAKVKAPYPDMTLTPPIFGEVKAATEPAMAPSISTQNKL
jgi:hypothetical protein